MHVYPVAGADTLHCSFQAVLVVLHLLESEQHPITWLEHIQHWKWSEGSPSDVGVRNMMRYFFHGCSQGILSGLHVCIIYCGWRYQPCCCVLWGNTNPTKLLIFPSTTSSLCKYLPHMLHLFTIINSFAIFRIYFFFFFQKTAAAFWKTTVLKPALSA